MNMNRKNDGILRSLLICVAPLKGDGPGSRRRIEFGVSDYVAVSKNKPFLSGYHYSARDRLVKHDLINNSGKAANCPDFLKCNLADMNQNKKDKGIQVSLLIQVE